MLSPVWSIKRFPDIDEKPMCLFLRAHNQGTWSTAVWANSDCSLCFQLSVHIGLKKRYRIVPNIKSNVLKMQLHELLLKFFGHKNHSFCNSPSTPRPTPNQRGFCPPHFRDNSPAGGCPCQSRPACGGNGSGQLSSPLRPELTTYKEHLASSLHMVL